MPTAEQILAGLSRIANQWSWLAIVWHGYLGVLVVGLATGTRPSRRIGGILLAMPLVSVSMLAWASGNPFNGALLGLASLLALVVAARLKGGRIALGPPFAMFAGAALLVFGWVYPHFLQTGSFGPYLYRAPTGLVPCPTLAVVVGLGLMAGYLGSRGWSFVIGVTGLFYGLFGAVRLGVHLDWVLAAGATLLLFAPLLWKPAGARAADLIAKASVDIRAPLDRVWRALVEPEAIRQYMFGTHVTSEWRAGSPITWKGEWQGRAYEDKGVITRLEPGRLIQYTHFSPLSGLPDVPENYHTVTIELSSQGAATRVSLAQDNNPTEEARVHSERNWEMMLAAMKQYLET